MFLFRRLRTLVLASMTGCLLAGLVELTPVHVYAHGELERSSPTANSVLTSSPDRVMIQMTEAPDPAFSEIKVFLAASEKEQQVSVLRFPICGRRPRTEIGRHPSAWWPETSPGLLFLLQG